MPLNVLVVDDSAVMRSMIIRTLKLSGLPLAEVHQAANGAEALAFLDTNWVDLALVDINMPVMDGEEMIARLRDNPMTEDLAVVVVSTESSETRIQLLRARGARFVHKPFNPEMIRDTVVELTGVSDEQQASDGPAGGSGPDF
jgi:two-component system chemotaxis response regulator CheY